MNLSLSIDSFGRLVCDIEDDGERAVVTAADASYGVTQLMAAIDDAQESGYGECIWPEGGGEYRWMLRRDGNALTIVLLWSRGTLTGWQHVLRTETRFEAFCARIRESVARLAHPADV